MDKTSAHYDKMTNSSIPKLIISLSIPTVVSMLISNIYNLVDTYFIGILGVSQSGAVGIVFPVMMIIQAVAFTFGHGSGSIISRRFAEKKVDEANEYFNTAFVCALAVSLLFVIVGLPLSKEFVYLMGATDTIAPYAQSYIRYILIAAPAITISLLLNNVLRYEGKAVYAMIGLTSGGIINMGLDPILIFLFNMDIGGAGLATAISQYISLIILLVMFFKKSMLKLNFKMISMRASVLGLILLTGLPSLVRQGLNSVSGSILNNVAKGYGDSCVSAMSIVSRCIGFFISIGLGIGQGFQPVAGFNYQLKKYDRLKKAFYFTLILSCCAMFVFGGLGLIFSEQIVTVFALSGEEAVGEVIKIGSLALRFTCLGLMVTPFSIVPNMLFQSSGLNGRAIFLSVLRSGACFMMCVSVLPMFIGVLGLQLSYCISDVISSIVAIPFFISFFHKLSKEEKIIKENA